MTGSLLTVIHSRHTGSLAFQGMYPGLQSEEPAQLFFLLQHGLSRAHPNRPSVLSPYLGSRGLRPDSDDWVDSPRSWQWILLP